NSYLLINDGHGRFTDGTTKLAPALRKAGLTTDAQWTDYDQDGDLDLLVVGDWMPVKVFENKQNKLVQKTSGTGLEKLNGLWQTIRGADFDKDGDIDFIAGNLGTNTKFRKSVPGGLKMYVKDIDGNGTLDQILTYELNGKWYPAASKDELAKQIPLINKKFTNYKDFAGKTIEELFDKNQLQGAQVMEVNTFESVYFENTGKGIFKQYALPREAQVSKIFSFFIQDVNQDGNLDVLLGGNLYGVSTYQGRYDASYGLLLQGNGQGKFTAVQPTTSGFLLEEQVRDMKSLRTANGELLLVARNGLPLQIFETNKRSVTHKPVIAGK
ncbi:MAG: RNA-binding protein, partial [Cytophagales bacterium CG18_big_fil_WC_8_21_14_2_50_42_9]